MQDLDFFFFFLSFFDFFFFLSFLSSFFLLFFFLFFLPFFFLWLSPELELEEESSDLLESSEDVELVLSLELVEDLSARALVSASV